MKQHSIRVWLCLLVMVLLLTACGKQAAEETLPTDMTTQPTTQTNQGLEDGELPQVTIPQLTEPSTQPQENEKPAEGSTPPETTKPTEGTIPPAATEPTEETTHAQPKPTEPPEPVPPETTQPVDPPETTEPTEGTTPPPATEPSEGTEPPESAQPPKVPPETSQPTDPTEPPFDEDELPPIPVG